MGQQLNTLVCFHWPILVETWMQFQKTTTLLISQYLAFSVHVVNQTKTERCLLPCFCLQFSLMLLFSVQHVRYMTEKAGVCAASLLSPLYLGVSERVSSEYQNQAKQGNLQYKNKITLMAPPKQQIIFIFIQTVFCVLCLNQKPRTRISDRCIIYTYCHIFLHTKFCFLPCIIDLQCSIFIYLDNCSFVVA